MGFDRNEKMVDHANRRARRERLDFRAFVAPMERFAVRGRFDLAFNLVCSFQYLRTEEDARAHVDAVARVLRPGGLYVLGVMVAQYGEEGTRRERFVATREGVRVVSNLTLWPSDRRTRTEEARMRVRFELPDDTREYESKWVFRTYGPRQIRAFLGSLRGFELAATYDFDYDVRRPARIGGDRLDLVIVLRRGDGAGSARGARRDDHRRSRPNGAGCA